MSQTGLFEAVVEPGSALTPNTMAEITVLELYGDFRPSQDPAALLKLRFVLLDAPGGIPANAILERVLTPHPVKSKECQRTRGGLERSLEANPRTIRRGSSSVETYARHSQLERAVMR